MASIPRSPHVLGARPRRRGRLLQPVAVALAFALVAGACGGSGDATHDAKDRATAGIDEAAVVTVTATPAVAVTVPTEQPPTPTPTPTPTPEPVAQPVRLRIPSIKVDAPIVPVGVNSAGEMDSPRDAWSVAWYAPGYAPGEPGNAVMAAHVDYINIGPAVFYNLKSLSVGDRIVVVAADRKEYEFAVRETAKYAPENAPLERIFGPNANHGLNLITCTGVFNASTHDYDQRVVVYAEAVRPAGPPRPNRALLEGL